MSVATWMSAHVAGYRTDFTLEEACAYIKNKWDGTRKENLEKHDVLLGDGTVYGAKDSDCISYRFGGEDCPWCYTSNKVYFGTENRCRGCPAVVAGMPRCDGVGSPYSMFKEFDDPKFMIEWVEESIEAILKKKVSG